ncbi:MAG: dihydroorotase family protein [Candidatus Acetothermia bacterium]|jgi:dihydroorotase|nr:dihydroorotase family protein [Candidatus Acetothermia bacterium]MDH7505766.1 dihydroorotase family protein [Candidatus Acetothermia bacterium]
MKVLSGGKVYIEGELRELDIGFSEKIQEIGEGLEGDRLDCSGLVILPGMIDAHVHFRDFDQAHKETWQTGGQAAAKGGVTTVLEMPNTEPPTTTLEMVERKRELASKSLVNFGLYGGLTEGNIELIPDLAREVVAFKLYLGETTGGLTVRDPKAIRAIFKAVAATGKVLAVHAQRGDSDAEARDLAFAIDLAARYDVRLHLAHVTIKAGVLVIEEAKRDVDLTCETCPHYLLFTRQDLAERGPLLLVNPPLAEEEDRGLLWEALQEGLIDILASDHAPHTLEEKGSDHPPSGLPGVETTLPLMLDAVNRGKLSLAQLVRAFVENPARRFGLKGKGRLDLASDADLVLVDLERWGKVVREELATKCGWSPYEGLELRGWPLLTIVRGEPVYRAPGFALPDDWADLEGCSRRSTPSGSAFDNSFRRG